MNDKTYKQVRTHINRLVRQWLPRLDLEHWTINNDFFDDTGHYAAVTGHPDQPLNTSLASTHVSWEYELATISWNAQECCALDAQELEKCVVHELCHVLVNPMREYWDEAGSPVAMKHEERVVTHLTRLFLAAYRVPAPAQRSRRVAVATAPPAPDEKGTVG